MVSGARPCPRKRQPHCVRRSNSNNYQELVLSQNIMNRSVIAVTLHSLFLAESRIGGCVHCSNRATMPFERLLDPITGNPATTSYVLPSFALCPVCRTRVVESTMVQPRLDVQHLAVIKDRLRT